MSNRRFIELAIRTGIQNRTGQLEYEHQATVGRQTYPDEPLGFKMQTDIQEAIAMPAAQVWNDALVDQKNQILKALGLGMALKDIPDLIIKGEDL